MNLNTISLPTQARPTNEISWNRIFLSVVLNGLVSFFKLGKTYKNQFVTHLRICIKRLVTILAQKAGEEEDDGDGDDDDDGAATDLWEFYVRKKKKKKKKKKM